MKIHIGCSFISLDESVIKTIKNKINSISLFSDKKNNFKMSKYYSFFIYYKYLNKYLNL